MHAASTTFLYRSIVTTIFSIAAVALLVACGSSGGGDSDDADRLDFSGLSVHGTGEMQPAQIFTPWLASVAVNRFESYAGAGNLHVQLLKYPEPRSIQSDIDFRLAQTPLDVCRLTSQDDNSGDDAASPPYVSGGPSVTINSSSGPWQVINQANDLTYWQPGLPLSLFPADATLSIPGDEFPSVSSYRLYDPVAPVRLSPESDSAVGAETVYSWVPDGVSNTHISMGFLAFNVFNENQGAIVICDVVDDGLFELPADAQAAIAGTDNVVKVLYDRVSSRIDYFNNISFFQTISVGE